MMASSIASTGAAAFHFGNAVDMEEMLEKMPKDRLVMGNIDPAGQFRNGTPESIREETLALMERCCKYDRHKRRKEKKQRRSGIEVRNERK